jgi:glycosyltransferase involved in cell wall biosynthesis
MKLAIVTTRYPQKNNPYNHMFVHVRAKYFQEMNVEVDVYVTSNTKSDYIFEGINVHLLPSKDIIQRIKDYDLTYLHLLNTYFLIKNGGFRIYQYLKKNDKPFAIYIHGSEVLKYPKYLFDFNLSVHGLLKYFYINFWNHLKMKQFIFIKNKNPKSLFLFPSKWMKNHTEKVLNVKLNNYQLIPNGIDTNHFKYSNRFPNRFKILMIRPLSDLKYGFDLAIEIMRYLPSEYNLTIYGKGKYEKKCKNLISKYNLENRVFIKNTFVERENLPDLFSNYGLFIATTRFDSQGVIMCEAMSSGLLTVSNPVTAIPEFVKNGINGISVESMNEVAMKILEITADEKLFNTMTQNARASMEEISIEKMGQKELSALNNIIE